MAAWLGVLLLALNLLAGAALPAHPLTVAFSDEGGMPLPICGSHGNWIFQNADDPPLPVGPDNGAHGQICIFCLPLLHAGLGMPSTAPIVAGRILVAEDVPRQAPQQLAVPSRFPSSASPRAPPSA